MYKLLTIDLDGTLLNSYGEVSENTREALKKAMHQGTEVVLASGRPISSTRSLAVELIKNKYLKLLEYAKKTAYIIMYIQKMK